MSDQHVRRPLNDPFAPTKGRITLPPRSGSAPAPEPDPRGRAAVPPLPQAPRLPGLPTPPAQTSQDDDDWDITPVEEDVELSAVVDEVVEDLPPLTPAQAEAMSSILAAHRPDQPLSLLFTLASFDDWQVRDTLARNETIPSDIVALLVIDEDPLVRRSLVRNPAVSDQVYQQLADDHDPLVLEAVIRHPRTSVETLNLLAYHNNLDVAESAVEEMERILAEMPEA